MTSNDQNKAYMGELKNDNSLSINLNDPSIVEYVDNDD